MSARNGSKLPRAAPLRKDPPHPTVCASCGETRDRDDMIFVGSHGILCRLCYARIIGPGEPRVPVPPSLFRRDGEKA